MARKVVGYREMIWTCPNCGAKNPGSVRICKSCGSPMGEDVQFEQMTDAAMINDEQIIRKAEQGPDIYCAYCGNRNPAGSKTCSRCGADLSEGHEREHGSQHSARLEEHDHSEPIICPACGTANPAGALKCAACGTPLNVSTQKEEIPEQQNPGTNGGRKGGGRGCLFFILAIIFIGILSMVMMNGCGTSGLFGGISENYTPIPNSFVDAVVSSQNWTTSIQVIGLVPSKSSAWEDQLPSDAENVRCKDRLRHTYEDEVRGSVEVCGTPYAVDMGNGYEQFVQDCVYEVYEPYCEFTVYKSGVIETRRANGTGPNPELPFVESQYSTGSQSASFSVSLRDESGHEYRITPGNLTEYRSFRVGDEYRLEITGSGRIVNLEKK